MRKQSCRLWPTSLPDCMPVPPHCQTRERACHWQPIQRKFHNICLLSHNGAQCSTGSGAEDEAEAKVRVCYCWRSCQGRNKGFRRGRNWGGGDRRLGVKGLGENSVGGVKRQRWRSGWAPGRFQAFGGWPDRFCRGFGWCQMLTCTREECLIREFDCRVCAESVLDPFDRSQPHGGPVAVCSGGGAWLAPV